MTDVQALRAEFDSAKRALVHSLFGSDQQVSEQEVQAALDHLTRVFNKLLLSTLDDYARLPDHQRMIRSQEYTFVHAINKGDEWTEPRWYVTFVNGKPVPDPQNPPSVRDFTRKMVEDGWKVISIPRKFETGILSTPDKKPLYELYFSRDLPQKRVSAYQS